MMMMMRWPRFILLVFLCTTSTVAEMAASLPRSEQKLLVVVFNGFRWDYIRRFGGRSRRPLSGLRSFFESGVRSEYLTSVFPSDSWPAWQTLNTGLYPEHHGILADVFFDRRSSPRSGRSRFFDGSDRDSTSELKWWARNEPLWATAKEQAVNVSLILWARCDVAWYGTRTQKSPHCESVFDKDNSKILSINLEKALIRMQRGSRAAIVYEDSVGRAGQQFGPLSLQVEAAVRDVDDAITKLDNRLREVNMHHHVNIVLMSDHGLSYGSNPIPGHHPRRFPSGSFQITKYSLESALRPVERLVEMVVGWGGYAMVFPKRNFARKADVARIVDALRLNMPKSDVYRREEVPNNLHWATNENAPPILIVAHNNTVILRASDKLQRPRQRADRALAFLRAQMTQGLAGYTPQCPDMRGIFMARGPSFKSSGEVVGPVQLVDVYSLLCTLLDIEAEPNDGDLSRIQHVLSARASIFTACSPLLTLIFITLINL